MNRKPPTVSKKSKKELKKAEAMMAKASKMQAKAQKLSNEAAIMQLTMLRDKRVPEAMSVLKESPGAPISAIPDDSGTGFAAAQPASPSLPTPESHSLVQHLRNHTILYTAIAAVIVLIGVYTGYAIGKHSRSATPSAAPLVTPQRSEAKPEAAPERQQQLSSGIAVLDTWDMPDELVEISSNAFIDADRVACIQDAEAIIYTYNLKTRQVESRLKFGKPGDYEALSVVGNIFYALRSDGHLFEVQPSQSGNPTVKEYDLPLGFVNETEPMFYDAPNDRLLVGVKEKDPQSDDYKGVYSFDLKTKTMAQKPVMTIPATHEGAAASASKKKKNKPVTIKPSEIALDPETGDLFVLNGPQAEFLIVGKDGALKQVIELDKSVFPQPEGMCFSPDGSLYISSEGGKKKPGVLAKVALR